MTKYPEAYYRPGLIIPIKDIDRDGIDEWKSGKTYFADDLALFGKYRYQCIHFNCGGKSPDTSLLHWRVLEEKEKFSVHYVILSEIKRIN